MRESEADRQLARRTDRVIDGCFLVLGVLGFIFSLCLETGDFAGWRVWSCSFPFLLGFTMTPIWLCHCNSYCWLVENEGMRYPV